jgi:hypothetical protein
LEAVMGSGSGVRRSGFDCRPGGNVSQWRMMTNTIQWPAGEFSLTVAMDLNAGVPPVEIRKKLAEGLASKTIIQTQKGDGKIKGKFQVVKKSAGQSGAIGLSS